METEKAPENAEELLESLKKLYAKTDGSQVVNKLVLGKVRLANTMCRVVSLQVANARRTGDKTPNTFLATKQRK